MEYTLLMLLYQSPVLALDVLRTYVKRYAENPENPALQSLEGAELLRYVITTINTAKEIFTMPEKQNSPSHIQSESRLI